MRLRRIEIINDPILGTLSLDFTDENGFAYDTIIFAGENGCGKSTLLNLISSHYHRDRIASNEQLIMLYDIEEADRDFVNSKAILRNDKVANFIRYTYKKEGNQDVRYLAELFVDSNCNEKVATSGYSFDRTLFLTPEIQFNSNAIASVTSSELDRIFDGNVRSPVNIGQNITQLLVDISNQDAIDFASMYKKDKNHSYSDEEISPRITRFNNAFGVIFDDLKISSVQNINNEKKVIFNVRGNDVSISSLSSGEKQLVFRGGFVLKDKNILNGAIVLIDEPELSLHPNWQSKILLFYQKILSNQSGNQTSQLFVATHSPFVIHNQNRKNDKVFVLKHEKNGIIVDSKPEYHSCNSIELVQDAFNVNMFKSEDYFIYLEGQTDEKYFNKTIEAFNIKSRFKFKWIGYIDKNGQERNTGKNSLNHAFEYLKSINSKQHIVLFYDCDANKPIENCGNIYQVSAERFPNKNRMDIGIENALNLNSINMDNFYIITKKDKNYGGEIVTRELDKMKLCNHICSINNEEAKTILNNVKSFIDRIEKLF